MLTKQDLSAISQLLTPAREDIKGLREDIKDIREELSDHKSDITSSIIALKYEFLEENRHIKRRLTEIKNSIEDFAKHFDKYLQQTRRNVTRIESHLKLPPLTD